MSVFPALDRFIELDRLRFHYREWPNPGAPLLLLLHGATSNARAWDGFAPEMCDAFRVVALDQRGHGETQWASDYSVQAMVADVRSLAAALATPRLSLLGHSMGGIVAWTLAATSPGLVEKLVITDVAPDVSEVNQPVRQMIQAQIGAEYGSIAEAVEVTLLRNPAMPRARAGRMLANFLVQRDDGRWVYRYDAAGLLLALNGDYVRAAEHWALVARVACPTLLLRGSNSQILSRETAVRMAAAIPDCRLVEVPDAAHSIFAENPAGFSAAVRPFLRNG